jgi:hypothetical protein
VRERRRYDHGSLRCGCGQFRGWLRKETYDFVTATIRQFGKPIEPITINTYQPISSKAGE